MKKERSIQNQLTKAVSKIRTDMVLDVDEDEEDNPDDTEKLPYVCLKFAISN